MPINQHVHDPLQSRFMLVFKSLLRKRDEHYEQIIQNDEEHNESGDDAQEYEVETDEAIVPAAAAAEHYEQEITLADEDVDWRKVLLLTGKPGTGKT